MTGEARIVVTVPEGWTAASLAAPDLSQAPEVKVLAWQAWGEPAKGDAAPLVAACFGGDTRLWTDEAEPIVLDRLRAVVSSTALRTAREGGVGVRSTDAAGSVGSEAVVVS